MAYAKPITKTTTDTFKSKTSTITKTHTQPITGTTKYYSTRRQTTPAVV